MIWTLGIYLAAYALLAFYIKNSGIRIKCLLAEDREQEALYDALNGEMSAEGQGEAELLLSRLEDAYNRQVARHKEIAAILRSVRLATIGVVVLCIIMTVTAVFGG